MNYPIYNFDYEYTLEEIVRYLKFFDKHIVYLTRPSNYGKDGILESNHNYRDNGLVIRLYWKSKTDNLHSGFIAFEKLMQLHKDGLLKLMGYDIIKLCENHSIYSELPTQECTEIYYNKVMKNRNKNPYNKEEYKLIEHNVNKKPETFDLLFDFLIEDINKVIAFEKYYEDRQRSKDDSEDAKKEQPV